VTGNISTAAGFWFAHLNASVGRSDSVSIYAKHKGCQTLWVPEKSITRIR